MNRTIFTVTIGMLALVAAMLVLGAGTSGAIAGETGKTAVVMQAQSVNASQVQQPAVPLVPITTTFTYQGYLAESGAPADGQYDFDFRLFDALTGGAPIGPIVVRPNEAVSNGTFTVALDFGTLNGTAGWLEIKVRRVGGPSFILLTPRQRLTPAPYAMTLSPGAIINGTSGRGGQILTVSNASTEPSSFAIRGVSAGQNGAAGLLGIASGPGSRGVFGSNLGSSGVGVYGEKTGSGGAGVFGTNPGNGGRGVLGTTSGTGAVSVYGESSGANSTGVDGRSFGVDGFGVVAFSAGTNGTGLFAASDDGLAGRFQGNVNITGSLSKGGGSFKIDHPLDPANKYLYHSFVESPDMMNIYNGNVVLDAKGEATVTLPDWFDALNKEYRYQLTAIGAPGPNLYISKKVENNRFSMAGGTAGMEVSWQVTGIRKDAYAEKNRIPVEEAKEGDEKGKYLYPEEHGQPESKGVEYERLQQMRDEAEKTKP